MRAPVVYTATAINKWHIAEEYAPGKWRPSRCCGFWGFRHIRQQFRIAWRVLIGRYDALNWEEGSGEKPATDVNYKDCTDPGFIRATKVID